MARINIFGEQHKVGGSFDLLMKIQQIFNILYVVHNIIKLHINHIS